MKENIKCKNEFLNYLKNEKNYSDLTIIDYNEDLSEFIEFLNNKSILLVEKNDIKEYLTLLFKHDNKSSTVSRKISSLKSFYKYLNYFNITFQDTDYFLVDSIYDKTVEDMGYYLSDNRDMPSALICVNDTIAIGVIKALKNHNYNIPKDISVVGHDNLPTDLFIEPLLTTIDVPKIDIAQSAVDILDKEIRYRQKEHFKICAINGTLIPRESSNKLIDNKNSI